MTQCEHPECSQKDTVTCFYPDNETEEPDHYYCVEHAFNHGFCYGCGLFWSGVERFDFAIDWGGIEGLCENCAEALQADFEEEFDEEEEEFDSRYAYYG